MNKLLKNKKNMVLCVLSLIFGYLLCMHYPINSFLEGFGLNDQFRGGVFAGQGALGAAEEDLTEAIERASALRAEMQPMGMPTGSLGALPPTAPPPATGMQTGAVTTPLGALPPASPAINR